MPQASSTWRDSSLLFQGWSRERERSTWRNFGHGRCVDMSARRAFPCRTLTTAPKRGAWRRRRRSFFTRAWKYCRRNEPYDDWSRGGLRGCSGAFRMAPSLLKKCNWRLQRALPFCRNDGSAGCPDCHYARCGLHPLSVPGARLTLQGERADTLRLTIDGLTHAAPHIPVLHPAARARCALHASLGMDHRRAHRPSGCGRQGDRAETRHTFSPSRPRVARRRCASTSCVI